MRTLHMPNSALQPIRGLPHGARALVVENRQYCRNTLRAGLQSLGLEVFLAPDVDRAERILSRVPIDLLILDIHRPEERQELEWARCINGQHPTMTLIVVADPSTDELEQRCDDLGAAAYLADPISFRTLRRCIERAFDGRRYLLEIQRLKRQLAAAKSAAAQTVLAEERESEHQVADLWFAIFEQLLSGPGRLLVPRVE